MRIIQQIRQRLTRAILISAIACTQLIPFGQAANASSLNCQAMAKDLEARQARLQASLSKAEECGYAIPADQIQQTQADAETQTKAFQSDADRHDYEAAEQEYNLASYSYALAEGMCMESLDVEARAVFLDRKTIVGTKNDAGMVALIDKLGDTGINVIYFETNNGGFPLFDSNVEAKSSQLDSSYDPLAIAVRQAHKRGMEVHAWIWDFAVGNALLNGQMGKPGNYPGPVLSQHGNFALLSRQGSARPQGQNEWWASAANSDADTFIRSFIGDIVTHYQVDGVLLDYIRYPFQQDGTEMGWDTISRTRFENEERLSLDNLDDKTKLAWKLWKASTVTAFVKSVANKVNRESGLPLSAAVYAMQEDVRLNAIQQVWEPWVENGYVNTLNPMTYAYNVQDFKVLAAYVRKECADKALPYPAIHAGRMPLVDLPEALVAARDVGVLGTTLFAVDQINNDQHLRLLVLGPYRSKAVLSPSSKPVLAAQLLFDTFADRVANCKGGICKTKPVLATKSEGDDLLAEVEAIQQDLHQLKESASQAELEAIIARLNSLQDKLKEWLRLETLVHRNARVDYLMLKLDNVRAVLTYGAQRARVRQAKTTAIVPMAKPL